MDEASGSGDFAFDKPHVDSADPPPDTGRRDRLWSVQLFRAIAALMIVIGHSQSMASRLAVQRGASFVRWTGLPWGAGVDLFFVISGFIMVYASRALFARAGARRDFLSRRLTRVAPLYWCWTTVVLAIVALATLKGGSPFPSPSWIAASYLFWPYRAPDGGIFPVLDLGWSLNYEMAFYIVFGLFIGLNRRVACLCIVAVLALAVAIGAMIGAGPAPLIFWTRPIVMNFAMGMTIGSLCCDRVTLAPSLRLILIASGTILFAADPLHIFSTPLGVTVDNGWARVLLSGAPAALIMAGGVLGPQPALPVWLRPAVHVGNASYSLYLVHPFMLIAVEKLVQKHTPLAALPLPLLVVGTVAGAVVAASLSFRFIERPLTAHADSLLRDGRDRWRQRHAA